MWALSLQTHTWTISLLYAFLSGFSSVVAPLSVCDVGDGSVMLTISSVLPAPDNLLGLELGALAPMFVSSGRSLHMMYMYQELTQSGRVGKNLSNNV